MNGYAVFDIETTGFRLHPDSIVEIAVVHVDTAGEITGSWDTLLYPHEGEAGPSHVHGITGRMVREAPTFAEVARRLHALFADRIPVAHRIAQFDGRFLDAHFTWSGIDSDGFTRGMCTWQLAHRYLPLEHHTLRDCCNHLGIDLIDAHRALDDTIATAHLLGHFIRAGHTRGHPARPIQAPPAAALASGPDEGEQPFHPRRTGAAAYLPRPARGETSLAADS